ncbi:MAG TPA: DUF1134 domain-containing protein [Rhizomicrobium sp.]|jgi:hypothetical protein|nr:DUF1134 domain-containing protein [Rhizomicrobium sp.]
MNWLRIVPAILAAAVFSMGVAAPARAQGDDEFTQNEIVGAASGFFGTTSAAVAKAVERLFAEQGLPDAYIKGDEGSGAVVVGLRYGSGWLIRKGRAPIRVWWQGPSVGFDIGANASKCFTLVYNLRSADRLFQKFPGVEGSYYFIAGIGVNYQRADGITLAPMRTGVGLRAGVNAGYLTYTRQESLNPF